MLADAPPELEAVVQDAAAQNAAAEHMVVTLTRAADGSLGLTVVSDDEGRPVVSVGREDVRAGDVLELRARTFVESYLQARFRSAKAPFELKVAYEDDYLAVVVKPSGRPTHSEGQGRMNLRSAVPFALRPPAKVDDGDRALSRPQPVHRLDKATSGLVLCAKTKNAAVEASRMFAERRVKKRYAAVLLGAPESPRGVVDADIPVSVNGVTTPRSARTVYAVERVVPSLKAESLTLIHFAPRTGRTHQLRRHAADVLRCPIVGDALYDGGGAAAMQFRRRGLFLCARYLELDHPCVPGERLRVEIPLPAKFDDLLSRESDRFERLA